MENNTTSQGQNQHHVPKFVLQRFAHSTRSESRCIYTLSKESSKICEQSIKEVASVVDQNTIDINILAQIFPEADVFPDPLFLEKLYGKIETAAAPILKRAADGKLPPIESNGYGRLLLFIAAQYTRTPGYNDWLWEQKSKVGILPIEDDTERALTELQKITKHQEIIGLTQPLSKKSISVFEAPTGEEFCIGDNPLVASRDPTIMIPENVAMMYELGSPSIRCYMPLTNRRALAILPNPDGWGRPGRIVQGVHQLQAGSVDEINKLQFKNAWREVYSKRLASLERLRDLMSAE